MSLYLISKDVKLKSALDRQLGFACHWINTLELLKSSLAHIGEDGCPVLLIDENLSERGHMPALELVLAHRVSGSKILLTGKLGYSKQEQFLTDGHIAILRKPFSMEHLIDGLLRSGRIGALGPHLDRMQRARLENSCGYDWCSSTLIGDSDPIVNVKRIIRKIGRSFTSVHINGETGTGKEVVADLLRQAAGASRPFVVMNCSSIPGALADTCLFGNAKGAYTDAKESRCGIVKSADGGILFLDEIEDLAAEVQGKLLRLLESKRFRPVGSDQVESSDFRLITASNVPLETLCADKALRFDLYNRLNRVVINLPPLRSHKEDIPLLIEHYFKKVGEDRRPDRETMERIMRHHWPGNVRELFKELDLLSVFAPEEAKNLSHREILTESALSDRVWHQEPRLVSEGMQACLL